MNSGQSPSFDDKELVDRFIAGDRQAFDFLYTRYAPQVLSFLAARARSVQTAEDLSQAVWSRVWTKRESFDGEHFKGWVFTIARRCVIDTGRRETRRREVAGIENEFSGSGHTQHASEIIATEELRERELQALRDCIKLVGGVFVEAIMRTQINDESPSDLAQEMGVARATIDTRVSRGKEKLKQCLEKKLK